MKCAQVTLEVRTPDGRYHRAEYTRSGKPKKPDGAFYLRYVESGDRKRQRLNTTDPNEAALLMHKHEAQLTAAGFQGSAASISTLLFRPYKESPTEELDPEQEERKSKQTAPVPTGASP